MRTKVVVITGANRGIGLETAKFFLSNGWKVIGTYRRSKSKIENPNFHEVRLDIADSDSIREAVKEIAKITPTVNVLINNSGVNLEHLSVTKIEIIKKVFDINLFGLIDFTEQLLASRPPKDYIINISSRKSLLSTPIDQDVISGYRMTKAALNMYTRTLAYRTKKAGIKVLSFSPGWVKTGMGYSIATRTRKPRREVSEVARELYKLVNTQHIKSGSFWTMGKMREW